MNLVIDANVFGGYFKESVIESAESELTCSSIFIFDRLGTDDRCFFDNAGIIKLEWRNLVEPEWFETWYTDCLRDDKIFEIPAIDCHGLKRTLYVKGFPKSKDIWYIKTCLGVKKIEPQIFLITEDLDFYDPTQKKCVHKTRIKILNACSGAIAKHLKKKEKINVTSVIKYHEIIS